MTEPVFKSKNATQLYEKLRARKARVAVVGLGYVGLPLAMSFGEAGFAVLGVDVDVRRAEILNRGESDIADVESGRVRALVKNKQFTVSTEYAGIADCDAIIICVPTPLRKNRDPDISYIVSATDCVAQFARSGQLVILESTTYPGTTREVVEPRLREKGLRVGEDVFLAFSPERIDPGNRQFGVRNTPKVVGGISADCTKLAGVLYAFAVDRVVEVSNPETAEMAKILENTFRAVNIGLANELALLCERLNLDVWEVVRAAATKPFGFMPFLPGPGIGGHCIPIDPLYLSWRVRGMDVKTRFIDLADDVNRSMPLHSVEGIARLLNEFGKSVRGSSILMLGVAYKRNVGDVRESPAVDVARHLYERGAKLYYYDPYVPSFHADVADGPPGEVVRVESLDDKTLAQFDAVAIITDHACVDYDDLLQHSKAVYDTRNATVGKSGKAVVHRLGSGVHS
ncbi:MAG: nucleotide sugar dehydrogenase [Planctomycetes bacterium]|nr:nucleotide sugar dehydrogenase [Planctomycetota bacterium]